MANKRRLFVAGNVRCQRIHAKNEIKKKKQKKGNSTGKKIHTEDEVLK